MTTAALVFALALVTAGPQAKVKIVADPSTPPVAGDRSIVFAGAYTPRYTAIDEASYQRLADALESQAYETPQSIRLGQPVETWPRSPLLVAINELIKQRRVSNIEGGTVVLVIAIHDSTSSTAPAAEVKVLGGPLRGKTAWIRRQDLVRLVERTTSKAKPAPKPE
jgi:hypothetical protein